MLSSGPKQELGILTSVAWGWYLKEKLQSRTVSVRFHHPQPLPFSLSPVPWAFPGRSLSPPGVPGSNQASLRDRQDVWQLSVPLTDVAC